MRELGEKLWGRPVVLKLYGADWLILSYGAIIGYLKMSILGGSRICAT